MSDLDGDDELAVMITMRFPNTWRPVLAEHLAPVFREVIAAGGTYTDITVMPVGDDDEGESNEYLGEADRWVSGDDDD